MHISLTPELEARVKSKVESGLYNNASEVIREALRFMETHETWIHEIKLAFLREQLNDGPIHSHKSNNKIDASSSLGKLYSETKRG